MKVRAFFHFGLALFLGLQACAPASNQNPTEANTSANEATETSKPTAEIARAEAKDGYFGEDFMEVNDIALNFQGTFEGGFGSNCAKPSDKFITHERIRLFYGKTLIHEYQEGKQANHNGFSFYDKNQHYPKLLKLGKDRFMYIFEANSGDPSTCGHPEGWIFSSSKLLKKVDFRQYKKQLSIEMDRDYSEREWWDMIRNLDFVKS